MIGYYGRLAQPLPVESVKALTMPGFCAFFEPQVATDKYQYMATVLGLVKSFKSLAQYHGRSPRDINAELLASLDAGFEKGVPIALPPGERRASCLINYQYYDKGELQIRTMTMESWGIRAVVYNDRQRDVLYLKAGKPRGERRRVAAGRRRFDD